MISGKKNRLFSSRKSCILKNKSSPQGWHPKCYGSFGTPCTLGLSVALPGERCVERPPQPVRQRAAVCSDSGGGELRHHQFPAIEQLPPARRRRHLGGPRRSENRGGPRHRPERRH